MNKKTKHRVVGFCGFTLMIMFGLVAWTSFWNTIYYLDETTLNNYRVRRHELTHIKQINRDGRLKFTIKYIWYMLQGGYKYKSLKQAYHNNPYEIEARLAEDAEGSDVEA